MRESTLVSFGLAGLLLTGCAAPGDREIANESRQIGPVRSAVVISIDALSESRMRETLAPGTVPALLDLFDSGVCADGAIGAFPSVTAAGHAALWTGAYGDVNGIAANWQPALPVDRHTLLEGVSGYFADGLRAEPIWITAARAGLRVGAHHVTQAPHAPRYPLERSTDPDPFSARRAEADSLLRRTDLLVMNGYNRMIVGDAVLTPDRTRPGGQNAWRGLDRSAGSLAPRGFSWAIGEDSIHALIMGEGTYDRVLISTRRDAAGAVEARAGAVETAPIRGRPLARHFSEPLHLEVDGSPVSLRFRLFSLSEDGSEFELFHTASPRLDASDPDRGTRYIREIGGWVGNGSLALLRSGAFGTPLSRGGDGSAEARYLETAELLTLQYMRGAEWILDSVRPQLFLDYFPLGDEIDHEFLGMVDRRYPGFDALLAARAQAVRERGWQLVDLRVERLRRISDSVAGSALFVSGDHGMRPAWRVFRPNAALRDSGLLEVDDAGTVRLDATHAVSPNGYWVSINADDRKGGIVPDSRKSEMLDRAERALLGARDESGKPIVTRVWRAVDHPDLGIGGPAGGDLYFEVELGFHVSSDAAGPVSSFNRPEGKHGFAPMASDMHTVLCAASPGLEPRRAGLLNTIDLAPSVSHWLGIPAPADARGRSFLSYREAGPFSARPASSAEVDRPSVEYTERTNEQ
jgi:hypothetical protein